MVGDKKIQIMGKYASRREVKSSVPQVSVLGPLLFIIFIDNVTENFTGNVSNFTDDLKIMCMDNTVSETGFLQANSTRISDSVTKWGMS